MPISRLSIPVRKQAGYSLLMVVFMVATILIMAAASAPNILTQGRREREEETVWRGEQYQRAIGLYFRKFGRYPTKIEDLTKQTNGVRFLRKAYKDPMNTQDGSWRFIYVGPNGQLIGSLRHTSLLQGLLTAPPVPGASPFGAVSQPAPPPGAAAFGAGQPNSALGAPPGAPAPNPLESQPQPLEGATIGGNIIGVGSKVKQSSLRIYEGGDTYEQWEFIWNPNQQGQALPATLPSNPATPGTTPPGGMPAPGVTTVPGAPPPPATTTPTTFP
jgi:type II secretory pathway pseudopilin PulG